MTTRYGGRYLQSIDGISGSLTDQRDWFFFVNGIEGDRSATEVTLHPGDVLWWDYRRWSGAAMSVPARRRRLPRAVPARLPGKTSVVGADRALAARIAAQVHGVVNARATPRNYIVIGGKLPPQTVRIRRFRNGALLELGTARSPSGSRATRTR